MSVIRVVIADDHPLYRDGLRASLAGSERIAVVGEAADGDAVVPLVLAEDPDVVVMDLQMPAVNGIEATARLHALRPGIAVLVLTMFDDIDSVLAALRAGARGYLLKGAREEDLVRGIEAAARGEAVFGSEIADRVLERLTAPPRSTREVFPMLTDREVEVLAELAGGRTHAEAASRLALSPKTVRNHVSNIVVKLGVRDRTEAIILAREAGLGQP